MVKHIPNFFTLLNLFFGCLAIIATLQPGLVPLYTANDNGLYPELNNAGVQYITIPVQICMASVFIGLAGLVDFLDGFIARALNATSILGKQLDSLADLVSFGVAPAMILYQFLRLAFAQQQTGLNIYSAFLLPALLLPCAAAYRLGRFNIDYVAKLGFSGLPTPAASLLVASFPLIYWFDNVPWFTNLLLNAWFLYGVILLLSFLMISKLPMLALKFVKGNYRALIPFVVLFVLATIFAAIWGWISVPLIFVTYVLLSLFVNFKRNDV